MGSAFPASAPGRHHIASFEACSAFTRVTACQVARTFAWALSRGSDPASFPTAPLASYRIYPSTIRVGPSPTGNLPP